MAASSTASFATLSSSAGMSDSCDLLPSPGPHLSRAYVLTTWPPFGDCTPTGTYLTRARGKIAGLELVEAGA